MHKHFKADPNQLRGTNKRTEGHFSVERTVVVFEIEEAAVDMNAVRPELILGNGL
jgi:hypothetical protein